MASSRSSNKERNNPARDSKVTANQLGYAVESLVMYKEVPYHICAISKDGTMLVLKRCDNANKMRDVPVTHRKLSLISTDDPLFEKWALQLKFHPFERTRTQELVVLRVLVERCQGKTKEARRKILTDMMLKNMWLGVWFRACYDTDREYRLKPEHVKHEKVKQWLAENPIETPLSLFPLLTKLQFNKFKPVQAAAEWRSMLLNFDKPMRKFLNMFLLRQFGEITYSDARYVMRVTNNVPVLKKRE